MTSQHRTDLLRVAAPTLEPDPVFLGMLADLSASSRTAESRTARPAGLRMIVAMASVAVIATATWAGGNGMGTPQPPADSPSQLEPSGPPSHGDVATPQRDVSISPGSPVSPGLPGTLTRHGVDARNGTVGDQRIAQGKQVIQPVNSNGKSRGKGKAKAKGHRHHATSRGPASRK